MKSQAELQSRKENAKGKDNRIELGYKHHLSCCISFSIKKKLKNPIECEERMWDFGGRVREMTLGKLLGGKMLPMIPDSKFRRSLGKAG
jgi:hypothetical protein